MSLRGTWQLLVEEECDGPMSIFGLPLCSSDGHAKPGRQELSERVRRVHVVGYVVGYGEKGWASQLLHGSFEPLDHGTVDSVVLEKSKDVSRGEVRVLGRSAGGTSPVQMTTGPRVSYPSSSRVTKRAAWMAEYRIFWIFRLSRRDNVPDGIQQCIEDSVGGLKWHVRKPSCRPREGGLEVIRAV